MTLPIHSPVKPPFRYRFPLGSHIFYISARSEQAAIEAAEDICRYVEFLDAMEGL